MPLPIRQVVDDIDDDGNGGREHHASWSEACTLQTFQKAAQRSHACDPPAVQQETMSLSFPQLSLEIWNIFVVWPEDVETYFTFAEKKLQNGFYFN